MSQTTNNNNTNKDTLTCEQMKQILINQNKINGLLYDDEFLKFCKKISEYKTMKGLIYSYHKYRIGEECETEEEGHDGMDEMKNLMNKEYKKICKRLNKDYNYNYFENEVLLNSCIDQTENDIEREHDHLYIEKECREMNEMIYEVELYNLL